MDEDKNSVVVSLTAVRPLFMTLAVRKRAYLFT